MTWPQLDEQDDHYLRLPGATVVATDALMRLHENLADVVAERAMMCVHGDAGLGKTLSVNAALRALAPPPAVPTGTGQDVVCRVQFRARPTPRDIRHVLFDALGVGGTPPGRPIEFDTLLKDVLAERFRVLVCDEAQWLSRECFEFWRHLWDDRRTQIAIVFVGGGDCYRVLRREPMLSSRIYVWQEFRRLTRDQVLTAIPAFHPVWADADPTDIAHADTQAGHGNFRAWARITAHTVTGLGRLGRDRPDRDVLEPPVPSSILSVVYGKTPLSPVKVAYSFTAAAAVPEYVTAIQTAGAGAVGVIVAAVNIAVPLSSSEITTVPVANEFEPFPVVEAKYAPIVGSDRYRTPADSTTRADPAAAVSAGLGASLCWVTTAVLGVLRSQLERRPARPPLSHHQLRQLQHCRDVAMVVAIGVGVGIGFSA